MQPIFDTLTVMLSSEWNEYFQQNYTSNHDYQHAKNFLLSYRGSEATFNAYRREIERFIQWCHEILRKKLCDIKRIDFENYIEFCQNPPKDLIGLQQQPRFIFREGQRIPNPNWRPFVIASEKNAENTQNKNYFLSQTALQQIFSIVSSFFNYLIQEDYLAMNPVLQIRQKSKYFRKRQKARIRRLSELQWNYVIETAEQMALQNPEHERTLFMMNALYGMYLRISELAATKRWQPKMGDFQRDHDGNWWFITVGKGNKERQVSVSDAMLVALKRYRKSLGLSELPHIGEKHPLLLKQRGHGAITSTRQIRGIVQYCFDQAILRLQADGFIEDAEQLKFATVHWLRHTGISEDVKHRPREHVRDDAGHGSSAITDRYIDVELRARHASAKKKKMKI